MILTVLLRQQELRCIAGPNLVKQQSNRKDKGLNSQLPSSKRLAKQLTARGPELETCTIVPVSE